MISETFATENPEDILVRQELSGVYNSSRSSGHFFARYAGIIMHSRFSASTDVATKRVKQLLELLLKWEGSGLETVRAKYSADLCKAISGIKDPEYFIRIQSDIKISESARKFINADLEKCLLASAAAVGNFSLEQKFASSYGAKILLGGVHRSFPGALCAAVASNQTAMVTWLMGTVRAEETGDVRHQLVEALQIAVRTFNQNTGNIILSCLSNEEWRPTLGDLKDIVRDCMIYGNIGLLEQILVSRKTLFPGFERLEAWNGLAMSAKEMEFLYLRGLRGGILDILGKKSVGLEGMGEHLPLDQATYCSRYDLARAILDAGAKIEARDRRGNGMTALQRAGMRGFLADVQFLLEEGADPDPVLCLPVHGYYCRREVLHLCEEAKAV